MRKEVAIYHIALLCKKYIPLVILVLTGCALFLLALLGIYARPQNDDFFYLASTGLTPHDSFNWSSNGRIAALAAYYLLYPLPHILQIVPGLTILLLAGGLTVLLAGFFRWINHTKSSSENWLLAAAASFITVLAMALMLPGLYAALYWFAALPPHAWSLCLTLLYIGLLLHRFLAKKWPISVDVLVFFVLPFIIGTLYETAALVLIIASIVIVVLHYWHKILNYPRIAWLSLSGSLISLAYLLLSPGAIRRRELSANLHHDTMHDRLLHLPGVLYHDYFVIMPRYLQHVELLPVLVAAGVLIGILYLPRKISGRNAIVSALAIAIAAFAFITIDMTVVWIGLNEFQAVREYLSVVIGLGIGSLLVGIIAGQYISGLATIFWKQAVTLAAAFIVVLVLSINMAYLQTIRDFRNGMISYSRQWDKRDDYIKHAVKTKQCNIAVNGLAINGSWHLNVNPHYWVGAGAMSTYYRVRSNGLHCTIFASKIVYPFGKPTYFENPRG